VISGRLRYVLRTPWLLVLLALAFLLAAWDERILATSLSPFC
jgi:hypothetical protein